MFFNSYRPSSLSWGFDILYNVFPKACLCYFSKALNLFEILMWYCFVTSSSLSFLRLNIFTSLCCLFTYYQSFLNFFNHQTVMCITISSTEGLYIKYTQIPSTVYEYVINPAVSLPKRRGPRVFMNVLVVEHHAVNKYFFDVAKFIIITPLSPLSWCRLSFPIVSLIIFFLPNVALKSPKRILIW